MRIADTFGIAAFAIAGNAYATSSMEELDAHGRALALKPCTKPIAVKSKQVTNKFEPTVKNEVQITRCVGVVAKTYRATSGVLPLRVELTGINRLPRGVPQVGSSRNSVFQALGKSAHSTASTETYSLSQERKNEDTVSFVFKSNRVSSVIWLWAVE